MQSMKAPTSRVASGRTRRCFLHQVRLLVPNSLLSFCFADTVVLPLCSAAFLGLKTTATELVDMDEEQFKSFYVRLDFLMARAAYWNLSRASARPTKEMLEELQTIVDRKLIADDDEEQEQVEQVEQADEEGTA